MNITRLIFLYKVVHGVLYDDTEAEGSRRRNQVDTVTEGIGLNRLTRNFARAHIDTALRVDDAESIGMARYLMRHEALFVGSSSALCCVAAVKLARRLPPESVVVTLACDAGTRHLSKFWSDEYLIEHGFELPSDDVVDNLKFLVDV